MPDLFSYLDTSMNDFIKYKNIVPRWIKPRRKFKQKLLRATVQVFVFLGVAMIYYVLFSVFFDTPLEYRMKASTNQLREEYSALSARYDTLETVLDNVIERDKGVFKILFESQPYEFDSQSVVEHEDLLSKSNKELAAVFFGKLSDLDKKLNSQSGVLNRMKAMTDSLGDKLNYIPAIQPVNNPELTLLTASYGMRIHPFYKTLVSHQGVDFTVSEGSPVFVTADGTVKDITTRNSSSGNSIVIDHGNGYQTIYNHLEKINVSKGQRVKRGDIIALSGNTGLSLAPHLHYEIRHGGMRVDPVHYFFMELDDSDYRKLIRIAQTGMQSFD